MRTAADTAGTSVDSPFTSHPHAYWLRCYRVQLHTEMHRNALPDRWLLDQAQVPRPIQHDEFGAGDPRGDRPGHGGRRSVVLGTDHDERGDCDLSQLAGGVQAAQSPASGAVRGTAGAQEDVADAGHRLRVSLPERLPKPPVHLELELLLARLE